MKKIVINGRFLARTMTGQERFAMEVIKELDKIVPKGMLKLIAPEEAETIPLLENIEVIRYGRMKSHLWEQTNLAWYVIRHKAICLNLCTIVPLIKPGIVCIHDISYKVNPQFHKTPYQRLSALWHRLNYNVACHRSALIYTVSEFSKQQIMDVYHVEPNRIHVVTNGWQHFKLIEEDNSIFDMWPQLKLGEYFFTLGSLAPNKNVQWILQVAQRNPQFHFAIAGRASYTMYGNDFAQNAIPNVYFLGYIDDRHIKALMRNCRALILPSFFEGFGVPPLEAMSVGAKVIVANASCLQEIYEDAAYYIDPENADVDLVEILNRNIGDAQKILEKCSFEKTARVILTDIVAL